MAHCSTLKHTPAPVWALVLYAARTRTDALPSQLSAHLLRVNSSWSVWGWGRACQALIASHQPCTRHTVGAQQMFVRWMHACTDGWMDGWMDRQMGGQRDW